MNLRNYNIYFHTHTISGIFIAAVLYVMFFAGSFAFFKDEIAAWQHNSSYAGHDYRQTVAFNSLLDSLDREYNLQGRNLSFFMEPNSFSAYVDIEPSKDTVGNVKAAERANFKYDFLKQDRSTYQASYDMGEFLYRLHFLAQLNEVPIRIGYPFGYMVAGLVTFLFLFALITGLLLHWDKIVSNFFVFRPRSKWKTVWTDAHTALGVIGFPYQFIFAVTGVVLIFSTVLIAPFSKALYDGDDTAVYKDLEYPYYLTPTFEFAAKPLTEKPDIDKYIQKTRDLWPNTFVGNIAIQNYGDENMHIVLMGESDYKTQFAGNGMITYRVADGEIVQHKSAEGESTYLDKVKSVIYRLHFGDYGGYPLKIIYFVLGLMGCVVILSGILIWLVARDKNNVPRHKQIFNFWATNVFVAACLSLLPVTALSFIAVKAGGEAVNMGFIYRIYFWSWLVLSAYYIVRRNLRRTNTETLLLGSFLGLLVPVANGVFSGNWIWHTYQIGAHDILLVDLLWISLSIVGLVAFGKIRKKGKAEGDGLGESIKTKQSSRTRLGTPKPA